MTKDSSIGWEQSNMQELEFLAPKPLMTPLSIPLNLVIQMNLNKLLSSDI